MPMAIENLAIAQHRDTLRYACIKSGLIGLNFDGSKLVIMYIYNVRHQQPWIVQAERTILRVKAILPNGVLLLEGKDGQEYRDNTKNCVLCHLPIEGAIYLELAVVPPGYRCFVCGKNKGATTMLLCDLC
jgi:hypothetical protein